MTVITYSALSTFQACPRRYHYQYKLGRVKLQDEIALQVGTAWHRAMEAYWAPGETDRTPAAIEMLRQCADYLDEAEVAKLLAMVETYHPPVDDFEVVRIEAPFEERIVNPETGRPMVGTTVAGKIDCLIRRLRDGTMWVLEHKTTASEILGYGDYWEALQIDAQIAIYVVATGASGAYYDVVRKPTIKLCGKDTDAEAFRRRCVAQRAEEPASWHQWREVVKSADDVAEAQLDLWQSAHTLSDCERMGRYPRQSRSCRGLFGRCPYIGVCVGTALIDDDTIFRTKESAHEEWEVKP